MIYSLEVNKKKNKFLEDIYKKFMRELEKFFEIELKNNKPKVFILPDKQSQLNFLNYNVPEWSIGWASEKNVYMISKQGIEEHRNLDKRFKNKKFSNIQYSALLKHELTHVATRIITNKKINPTWLWEGIAIHLSGQTKLSYKKPEKLTKFLEFYDSYAEDLYKESGFAVEHLIKKHGKKKLLNLIEACKSINSKQEFNKKFKEIYGFVPGYKYFN